MVVLPRRHHGAQPPLQCACWPALPLAAKFLAGHIIPHGGDLNGGLPWLLSEAPGPGGQPLAGSFDPAA